MASTAMYVTPDHNPNETGAGPIQLRVRGIWTAHKELGVTSHGLRHQGLNGSTVCRRLRARVGLARNQLGRALCDASTPDASQQRFARSEGPCLASNVAARDRLWRAAETPFQAGATRRCSKSAVTLV